MVKQVEIYHIWISNYIWRPTGSRGNGYVHDDELK